MEIQEEKLGENLDYIYKICQFCNAVIHKKYWARRESFYFIIATVSQVHFVLFIHEKKLHKIQHAVFSM